LTSFARLREDLEKALPPSGIFPSLLVNFFVLALPGTPFHPEFSFPFAWRLLEVAVPLWVSRSLFMMTSESLFCFWTDLQTRSRSLARFEELGEQGLGFGLLGLKEMVLRIGEQ
jgi:hypothetical protein